MSCCDDDLAREIAQVQALVDKYYDLLLKQGGMQSVSTDGLTVTYATGADASIVALHDKYTRRLKRLKGQLGPTTINLSKGLP